MSDTLKLTTELINRKTLTPDDNGCQKLIAKRLSETGFSAEHLRFDDVDKRGKAVEHFINRFTEVLYETE